MSFKLPEKIALLVTSDIHIRSESDSRYDLLCQLVEEAIQLRPGTFVLNGDIFDFFFGWRGYFRGKYSRLLGGLDRLQNGGTAVWFVEGNHEFGLLGLTKHHKFQIVSSDGKLWSGSQNQKIFIAHGDLLKPDVFYTMFRSIVRSNLANLLASIFPQSILDKMTLWFASTSRKKDKYRELNHKNIMHHASQKLTEVGADTIIFGHFHYPYDEHLDNGKRILSVTSCSEPSCLVVLEDGDIIRLQPQ